MRLTLICLLIALLGFSSCSEKEKIYKTYEGEIFGTYYRIQVEDLGKDLQPEFDSVFALINAASNSYVQESEVSAFNRDGKLLDASATFKEMMDSAAKYNRVSQGFFEPTLYPLIKAWGFSFEKREEMDSAKIRETLALVGFEAMIQVADSGYFAAKPGVMLDITGLGEGYAIDNLVEVVEKNGIANYMVEIGGEMKAKGLNSRNTVWTIGIEDPIQAELGVGSSMLTKVELDERSISSSGNYRKFYIDEAGNRRPHIIDPKTGYPVSHNMVSVSVLAPSATQADALATAFMGMGVERAKALVETIPGVEAMFVIGGKEGLEMEFTSGFPRTESTAQSQ
ncbi:FAD:protein FMN transferase [Algoriphagus sp. H41]|uniref:FAD:protein FMN transferase n=1 Tax=Algoriphagus oliviformis TaxID=2811231 RepID=A0ABS3C2Z9_9BACT|nr:FAD:protein FMN transferase [Algoriphagus oliviformis]MBN7810520.1 FAD:protein FMN transferase [Algoriphagus oliviformis]